MSTFLDNFPITQKGSELLKTDGKDATVAWFNSLSDADKQQLQVEYSTIVKRLEEIMDALSTIVPDFQLRT